MGRESRNRCKLRVSLPSSSVRLKPRGSEVGSRLMAPTKEELKVVLDFLTRHGYDEVAAKFYKKAGLVRHFSGKLCKLTF